MAFTCPEIFPSQMYLNYLSNYVPDTWNYEHGCTHCDDDVLDLSQLKVSYPLNICCSIQPPPCGHSKGRNRSWSSGVKYPSISDCLDSGRGARVVIFQRICNTVTVNTVGHTLPFQQ